MTRILYKTLYLLRIFHLLSYLNRRKIVILSMHDVIEDDNNGDWSPLRRPLAASRLKFYLETLRRTHNLVDFDTAIDMLRGSVPLVPKSVAVTFDDGYLNNMTDALPIVKKFDIRPAFFIPTGFVTNIRPFWFDRFDYAIQQLQEPYELSLEGKSFVLDPDDRDTLSQRFSRIRAIAKNTNWNDEQFNQFFDSHSETIEHMTGKSLASIQRTDQFSNILSPEDLRALHEEGSVCVASHTVNHMRIDRLPPEERLNELRLSKTYLEELLGTPCEYFCYPNGSFDDQSRDDVESAGYRAAVTSDRCKLRDRPEDGQFSDLTATARK